MRKKGVFKAITITKQSENKISTGRSSGTKIYSIASAFCYLSPSKDSSRSLGELATL